MDTFGGSECRFAIVFGVLPSLRDCDSPWQKLPLHLMLILNGGMTRDFWRKSRAKCSFGFRGANVARMWCGGLGDLGSEAVRGVARLRP